MARPKLEDYIANPHKDLRKIEAVDLLKQAGFKDRSHKKRGGQATRSMHRGTTYFELCDAEGNTVLTAAIEKDIDILYGDRRRRLLDICQKGHTVKAEKMAIRNSLDGPESYINTDNSFGMRL